MTQATEYSYCPVCNELIDIGHEIHDVPSMLPGYYVSVHDWCD
jgi:hypothetical protein